MSLSPDNAHKISSLKIIVSEVGAAFLREQQDEIERKELEKRRAIEKKRAEEELKKRAAQEQAFPSSELRRFNTFKRTNTNALTSRSGLAAMTRMNSERLPNLQETIASLRKDQAGMLELPGDDEMIEQQLAFHSKESPGFSPISRQESPLSSMRRVNHSKKSSFRLKVGEGVKLGQLNLGQAEDRVARFQQLREQKAQQTLPSCAASKR
jgi:hypothetical protein